MPFLEGVPCSIHGIVYPDHVIAVRPVEQISLRRAAAPTFFYAGCATFYDPPAGVAEADAGDGAPRRRPPALGRRATAAPSPSTAWSEPTASCPPS